ncbi:hypothetical protein [Frigoribacterium sp. Leaf186]|uniref:hypothetical protein n=1 Tax=Frigoribacterium sp. Leaf186 TaxID=1736293 RepID=UPI000AD58B65|nr:hypothetical protein [Frigoribacterium sp. Leaf186]
MIMAIPGGEVTVGELSKVQSKLHRALATSSICRISREIDAMERVDGFVVASARSDCSSPERWTAATWSARRRRLYRLNRPGSPHWMNPLTRIPLR